MPRIKELGEGGREEGEMCELDESLDELKRKRQEKERRSKRTGLLLHRRRMR